MPRLRWPRLQDPEYETQIMKPRLPNQEREAQIIMTRLRSQDYAARLRCPDCDAQTAKPRLRTQITKSRLRSPCHKAHITKTELQDRQHRLRDPVSIAQIPNAILRRHANYINLVSGPPLWSLTICRHIWAMGSIKVARLDKEEGRTVLDLPCV